MPPAAPHRSLDADARGISVGRRGGIGFLDCCQQPSMNPHPYSSNSYGIQQSSRLNGSTLPFRWPLGQTVRDYHLCLANRADSRLRVVHGCSPLMKSWPRALKSRASLLFSRIELYSPMIGKVVSRSLPQPGDKTGFYSSKSYAGITCCVREPGSRRPVGGFWVAPCAITFFASPIVLSRGFV